MTVVSLFLVLFGVWAIGMIPELIGRSRLLALAAGTILAGSGMLGIYFDGLPA